MIIDNIQNAERYSSLHPLFGKAFDFLRRTDLSNLKQDRYNLEGEDLFALIQRYTTRDAAGSLPEAHKRYIDIQYIAKGKETIGVSPKLILPVIQPYNADSDILFYEDFNDSPTLLEEGDFAVFFPGESHRPCCHPAGSPEDVTKILLKIIA